MNETQIQTATVDFHGHTLITVRHNGNDYIAMKPVVEGIGLDWKSQYAKIRNAKRYGDITIPLQTPGGFQEMLCIPLKKLNEWLFSIHPEKVRPEIRAAVVMYQEECFLSVSGHRNRDAGIHSDHRNIHENQIETATVDFYGHTLITVRHNNAEYVAMKPVCEGMGLDWEAQRQLIERDQVLRQVTCKIQVVSEGKDNKTYHVDTICLPLMYLNGWLFKINAARYRENDPRRHIIIQYQRECYSVLYNYWHKGIAVNPRFQSHHRPREATIAEILSEAEAGMDLARILGLPLDHARRFMNEMVKKAYGTDCLEIAEQTRPASERPGIYLTTTQLGKRLGLTPHKTNKLLERCGLIESFRNDKDQLRWKPTARGKPYVIGKGAKRNPDNYEKVHQLLFLESVVEVIGSSSRLG
ncbi:phage antirepressor N-terminal domain-containing protein [Desulfonema magnum]|uniref:Antirepressor protein ANT doman-containing protein n=1 Tax=Desulfonema magnum TaxID=45655 RepID=A0A975BGI3_9BACT|nr:phage antirepressor N-terminal domain-containing protein [Desulfonema magnum]QTA84860.1 Antirepressor protein ANT doman-containing protein [Desulfonema magnum]